MFVCFFPQNRSNYFIQHTVPTSTFLTCTSHSFASDTVFFFGSFLISVYLIKLCIWPGFCFVKMPRDVYRSNRLILVIRVWLRLAIVICITHTNHITFSLVHKYLWPLFGTRRSFKNFLFLFVQ